MLLQIEVKVRVSCDSFEELAALSWSLNKNDKGSAWILGVFHKREVLSRELGLGRADLQSLSS
jgi:hypothetical protein